MARTKQTARKKIAKKSALATQAPVKKTQTSKRKGYVSPQEVYHRVQDIIGEQSFAARRRRLCLVWLEGTKMS